jgi:hypothetical protein
VGLGEEPDAEALDGETSDDEGEAHAERREQNERGEGNDESGHEQQTGGEPQTISLSADAR